MTFTLREVLLGMLLGFIVILGMLALADKVSANSRVTICHSVPPNAITIEVGAPAVATHLAHGDTIGECRETERPTVAPPVVPVPVEPTPTESTERPGERAEQVQTETSSVVIASLPVTGRETAEVDKTWPLRLAVVGILSTGMAFVMRRQGGGLMDAEKAASGLQGR